jgi:hypothetical protein
MRLLSSTVLLFILPLVDPLGRRAVPARVLGFGMLVTSIGIASIANPSTGSTWTHLIRPDAHGLRYWHRQPGIAKIGLEVVEPQRSGLASGISNTFRIGGTGHGCRRSGRGLPQQLTSDTDPTTVSPV